jgi:hypothetical protein
VQAFVEECTVERPDGTLGLVLAGNPDGTVRYASPGEPITRADHFNRLPFRNLNFSQIDWVKDEHGLIRYLPKQERGLRQAFNARCKRRSRSAAPAEVRSADREVRRSQSLLAYGDDHARDRTPSARRRECSPTWSSGPRSVGGC